MSDTLAGASSGSGAGEASFAAVDRSGRVRWSAGGLPAMSQVYSVPASTAVLVPSAQSGTRAVVVSVSDGHVLGCVGDAGEFAQAGDSLVDLTRTTNSGAGQTRLMRAGVDAPNAARLFTVAGAWRAVSGDRSLTVLAPVKGRSDGPVRSLMLIANAGHRTTFTGPLLPNTAGNSWAGVQVAGVTGTAAVVMDVDSYGRIASGLAVLASTGAVQVRIPARKLPCPRKFVSTGNVSVAPSGIWVACVAQHRLAVRQFTLGGTTANSVSIPIPNNVGDGFDNVVAQDDGVWITEAGTERGPGFVAHVAVARALRWTLLTAAPGWYFESGQVGPAGCSCAVIGYGQSQGRGSSGLAYAALYAAQGNRRSG